MVKKLLIAVLAVASIGAIGVFSSCKGCKKDAAVATVDTTATVSAPVDMITTPHGDSSLIPVFAKLLDDAFAASKSKDYAKLASLMIYRGPEPTRHGQDIFSLKNSYEKGIVKVTADVFNKWTAQAETREYPRVFTMPQPDGRNMDVLEVIFIGPKKVDRKFFGFLPINGEYKIADVTSHLE